MLFYCLKNCPNGESVSMVTWNSDTIMCPCMMLMGHSLKTTCLTKNTNNAVLCLECLCVFHLVPFDSCDRILKRSTRLKCCDAHAVLFFVSCAATAAAPVFIFTDQGTCTVCLPRFLWRHNTCTQIDDTDMLIKLSGHVRRRHIHLQWCRHDNVKWTSVMMRCTIITLNTDLWRVMTCLRWFRYRSFG